MPASQGWAFFLMLGINEKKEITTFTLNLAFEQTILQL